MKKLIIILSLITTNLISQNSESYYAMSIKDELYHYFDSLGTNRLETISECDCNLQTESVASIILDKSDNKHIKSNYIDTLILNDYISDEDINEFMSSYLKFLKEKKIIFKDVLIEVNVKRTSIRFNIFRFRYKVRYRITIDYNYNPVEKK